MIIHMSGRSFGEEASAWSRLTTEYRFRNLSPFALLELWLWESTVSLAFNWQAIKRKWTSCHSHTPECTCVHGRAGGTEHSALINHLGLITPDIFQPYFSFWTRTHTCVMHKQSHTRSRLLLFKHNNSRGARMCLMLIDQYSGGGGRET